MTSGPARRCPSPAGPRAGDSLPDVTFTDPQVILFVADPEASGRLYRRFGFRETFRTSPEAPIKVEMALGGFTLGLALPEPAAASHGITPVTSGHRACITLWTDDVEAAYAMALEAGARDHRGPHPFLDGRLRVALVEDLDGHPIQLVQKAVP
jgi:catechol 2,3-dioxygenase-like lactoylglutathione lyase family enzyme